CCSRSIAQVDNASLSGSVRDQSGAVVPNAGVTLRNTDTRVEHTVPTNNVGAYLFPNVIPGPYILVIKAKGFRDETITGVTLAIAQQARIDMDLQVGAVGEQVTVTNAPPLLQTEDASVGTVIGNQQVVDLPLNG